MVLDIVSIFGYAWFYVRSWFETCLSSCGMTGFVLACVAISAFVRILLGPLLAASLSSFSTVDTAYSSKPSSRPYVPPSRQLPSGHSSKSSKK